MGFDKKLGTEIRTLLVSFSDNAWLSAHKTGHLHVAQQSGSKIVRFQWLRPGKSSIPSIAITFKTISERDAAKTMLEASNSRAADSRPMWNSISSHGTKTNLVGGFPAQEPISLRHLLGEMLPYNPHVPSYHLVEKEEKKRRGYCIRKKTCPSWL